jgi:hypothetical protein
MEKQHSVDASAEGRDRRVHDRISGPFDGRRVGGIATPVRLYDVSVGGCFINSMYEQKPGVKFVLEMDLPLVGVVTVNAEVLYVKPEFGFAVRFIDMSPEAKAALQRSVDAMLGLPPQ